MNTVPKQANYQIISEYWAKYCQATGEIHRLECHLADVGAVMETLLEIPSIRRSAAKAGQLTELNSAVAARYKGRRENVPRGRPDRRFWVS